MVTTSPLADHKPAASLSLGQKARIAGFTRDDLASKLLTMGLLPGSTIQVVRKAPFGRSWYVLIDEYAIALRQEELSTILVVI